MTKGLYDPFWPRPQATPLSFNPSGVTRKKWREKWPRRIWDEKRSRTQISRDHISLTYIWLSLLSFLLRTLVLRLQVLTKFLEVNFQVIASFPAYSWKKGWNALKLRVKQNGSSRSTKLLWLEYRNWNLGRRTRYLQITYGARSNFMLLLSDARPLWDVNLVIREFKDNVSRKREEFLLQ